MSKPEKQPLVEELLPIEVVAEKLHLDSLRPGTEADVRAAMLLLRLSRECRREHEQAYPLALRMQLARAIRTLEHAAVSRLMIAGVDAGAWLGLTA